MDLKKIKKLITLVETSNISALCLEEDNIKIEIKKETTQNVIQTTIPQDQPQAIPTQTAVSTPTINDPITSASEAPTNSNSSLIEIKSPMVGTFYAAPNEDSPAYVSEGQAIKKGDVVCIVEAMKLFNEIEAEIDGSIDTICVKNGDPVEFGQVLFLVNPN